MRNKSLKEISIITVVLLLLVQVLSSTVPWFSNVSAEDSENSLRIHYETDTIEGDLSLWLWGDIAEESDVVSEWPNGTVFSENNQTDYGYYIDVSLTENASEVGLLVVDGEGETYTDDIEVELYDDVSEVWISQEEIVYYYEPIDFQEPTLRIHYYTEATQIEPSGVWFWGDAQDELNDWPTDAVPFVSDQVGEYGYYVDIPMNEGATKLEFIVVNREDGSQTEDLRADNLDMHQQVFLHEEHPNKVFTNPFYISGSEGDSKEDYEGKEDISISASVNQPFHYDQHALLDVDIDNNSEIEISRIKADVSSLGGSSNLPISPELNRVTLSATHNITPGEYTIPISVWDENNGRYDTEAIATVIPNDTEGRDWDEEIIYFMLTDRFADGDPSNNDPYGLDYESVDNPRGAYQGGDFVGVTENLDYLDDLGITTIWVSPIVENVAYDVSHASDDGSYYAYHGYWAVDFEELNPHLGTLKEFHNLIDEAAERDIDIMVDVVLNHTGYGLHPDDEIDNPPVGYPTNEERARFDGMLRENPGSDDLTMELSGLPDFITENHDVRTQVVDWQTGWIERSTTPNGNAIASYRVDTVKHVDDTTWQHFKNELVAADPNFRLIGESWGAGYQDDHGYLNTGMMDSLLDFRYKSTAGNFVNGQIEAANNELIERNQSLTSAATLGQFLGSHDEDGFLYSHDGDEGKLKLAATLQMTSKGQPVIYYGEELGQTGPNNWPIYDNRYDFGWDNIEGNDILDHYQRVIQFRNDYSELLSRGTRSTFIGSDEDGWLIAERSYNDETVYLALNTTEEEQEITLDVSNEETRVRDHYSDETFEAQGTSVTFTIPTMANGGTALLSVQDGDLLPTRTEASAQEQEEEGSYEDEVVIEAPIVDDAYAGDTTITGEGQLGTTALAVWSDEVIGTGEINSPFEIELIDPLEEGAEIEIYLEDENQNRSETVRLTVLPQADEENNPSEENMSNVGSGSETDVPDDSNDATEADTSERIPNGERLPVTATTIWTIGLLGFAVTSIGLGIKKFSKNKE